MRKLQMTCWSTQACGWPGQDKIMSCPNTSDIWYTVDWLGTRQYRELGRVSRSRLLLSFWPLPRPYLSPHISGERESGFFPGTKYMAFTPSTKFPTTNGAPTVHWLLIPYLWSQGQCHRLRYQECPDFRCQPCVLELSCFRPSDWN